MVVKKEELILLTSNIEIEILFKIGGNYHKTTKQLCRWAIGFIVQSKGEVVAAWEEKFGRFESATEAEGKNIRILRTKFS